MMIDINTILRRKNNIITFITDSFERSSARSFLDLTPNNNHNILFIHMSALCQK
tara:strand:+ start:9010 stop:9171 length:162 start_codon:yes stop_codon:yes gene_type:complete